VVARSALVGVAASVLPGSALQAVADTELAGAEVD